MKMPIACIFSALSLGLIAPVWASDTVSVKSDPAVQNQTQATNTSAKNTSDNNTEVVTAAADNNSEKADKTQQIIKADLKLTQEQNKLYAKLVLTQSTSQPGNLRVSWIAPSHSGCNNSHYSLSYNYKQYHTNAYRTVMRSNAAGNNHVCAGTWQVRVYDANKKLVASASYDVSSEQKQAANAQPAADAQQAANAQPAADAQQAANAQPAADAQQAAKPQQQAAAEKKASVEPKTESSANKTVSASDHHHHHAHIAVNKDLTSQPMIVDNSGVGRKATSVL